MGAAWVKVVAGSDRIHFDKWSGYRSVKSIVISTLSRNKNFQKGGSSALNIMLAERRGDEKANSCSIGLGGNHVDVGRGEQERDHRDHPATSAMVHAVVLHRRPRASAAARRLKSGRGVDRSCQDPC